MTRDFAEPDFALLDEPSMGLVPTLFKKAFHIIANLKSQGGRKSLLKEFGIAVLNAPDYGCALENSMVAEYRRAGELRTAPSVTVAFLDMRHCRFVGQTLIRHPKHRDCITQGNRVLFQRFGRRRSLFDERGIVLCDLVDL